jgi:hypothetical protein
MCVEERINEVRYMTFSFLEFPGDPTKTSWSARHEERQNRTPKKHQHVRGQTCAPQGDDGVSHCPVDS